MLRLRLICHPVPCAVATLGVLAAGPVAHAATVSVPTPPSHKGFLDPPRAQFLAAPGEANRLQVSVAAGTVPGSPTITTTIWTFHDEGAPITPIVPGGPCTTIDERTASCSLTSLEPIVLLGDGADQLVASAPVDANGGDGDDTLTAKSSADAGNYSLSGGASVDVLDATEAPRSTLFGDAGSDTLLGSRGPDFLLGGPGSDTLQGAAGDDTLRGEGGADSIACGEGDHDLATVDGRDVLAVPAAAAGPPSLGISTSLVPFTDCDRLAINTARKNRDFIVAVATATLDGSALVLGARKGSRWVGELQLTDPSGRLLGRASMRTKAKVVRLALTAHGRAVLVAGTTTTANLRVRPAGGASSPARGPGTKLALTIRA